jgi:IPT/TIG domain
MIDAFVLLTPFLLLGVVALLGFVGCNALYGVYPTTLAPEIDTIIPNFGPSAGGTPVQISGSGLNDIDGVTFGGVNAASFTVMSDKEIDAVTPPNPAGQVTVEATEDGSGFGSLQFTYMAIGFVQVVAKEQATIKNPPLQVTVPNTMQGNLLIATVSYLGGSVTVADDKGNAFILAGVGPWTRQSSILYLPNIPGGDTTITVTGAGGASGPCSICVSEYSGATQYTGTDPGMVAVYGFGTNFMGTGTAGVETMQGVTVTPAQSGDAVYVVVFATKDTALMAGAGFAAHPSTVPLLLVEDIMSPVGATQVVATDDTTGGTFIPWVILAVAIRA